MIDKLVDYADFSNEELLDHWAVFRTQYNTLYREMEEIKIILDKRMKANRARKIPHSYVDVDMGAPTAIVDRLIGLKEVVGEEEFNKAFTPAHVEKKEVDVPDKISLTVVNGWAKHGDHVRDIIDYGTDHQTAKLVLKLKKDKSYENKD